MRMTTLEAHQQYLAIILERQKRRRKAIDPDHAFSPQYQLSSSALPSSTGEASKDNVVNYVPAEETVRNDYTAWYTASGVPGADYILGARDHEICEEYPALRRLMDLKTKLVDQNSHPPLYLPLTSSEPNEALTVVSPNRFDVILVTPSKSWEETAALPIRSLSADPSFVFLWVGRGDEEGLERGRECFARWGFRRAEDIVWVKTTNGRRKDNSNENGRGRSVDGVDFGYKQGGLGRGGLLASQKEHCLMGIRGTVRRSTDTRFAHCNVDTDILLWEDTGKPDQPRYPPYLYTLIESFCLGTRRLQISPPSCPYPPVLRRGWVTASSYPLPPHTTRFDPNTYHEMLPGKQEGRDVLPYDPEIDILRPKSPSRPGKRNESGQIGAGSALSGQGEFGAGAEGREGNSHRTGYRGGSMSRGRGRGGPRMDGRQPNLHQPGGGSYTGYQTDGPGPFPAHGMTPNGMAMAAHGYGYGMPQAYDPHMAMAYQMAQLQLQSGYTAQQGMYQGQQYDHDPSYKNSLQGHGGWSPAPTFIPQGYGEGWSGSNYGGPTQGQGQGQGQWQYQ